MITDIKVHDNFYSAPDAILKLVNEFPITGCGTGARSIDLQQLNPSLGDNVKNDLCQIHGVNPNSVKMNIFFMEHEYNFKDEIFNTTTIHMDGKNPDICRARVDEYKLAFCGQILLTKDPDPDAVVTIHKFKSHINWDEQEIVKRCIDEYTNPGEFFRAGKIDLEEFKRMRKEHADNFDLTCEVKNLYNRMVSWKGGTLHAQRITKSAPKVLNQYFFAEWI
jgi:hypothetical protein